MNKAEIDALIARIMETSHPSDRDLNDDVLEAFGFERKTFTAEGFYRTFPLIGLEAAMNFVPHGFFWLIAKGKTAPEEPMYGAAIYEGIVGEAALEPIAAGESNVSPAVALCIAIMRLPRA